MKISGRVVSTKSISLNRAAKLISRFAAVENGSSPAVSRYLQRTSEAFNRLVQSRSKTTKSEKEMINGVKSDAGKKKRRKSGEAEKKKRRRKSGSKKTRDG